MVSFENSRFGRDGSKNRSSPKRSFNRDSRKSDGRKDRKERTKFSSSRSNNVMTRVNCSSCGISCEVPFKPSSNKPVYCDNCYNEKPKLSKPEKVQGITENDLDIINEKLNKIMRALNIK